MRTTQRLHAAARLAFIAAAFAATAAYAQNPCSPRNPCAAKNPCAAAMKMDPTLVTRPAGTALLRGDQAALAREGERLFKDAKLGSNGLSCQSCHANGASFNASFAQPYPHRVAMPEERAGLKQVTLDEMVQFCTVAAMAGKPLPWGSRELAALTTYTAQLQKNFKPVSASAPANPCAAKNPCAPKK